MQSRCVSLQQCRGVGQRSHHRGNGFRPDGPCGSNACLQVHKQHPNQVRNTCQSARAQADFRLSISSKQVDQCIRLRSGRGRMTQRGGTDASVGGPDIRGRNLGSMFAPRKFPASRFHQEPQGIARELKAFSTGTSGNFASSLARHLFCRRRFRTLRSLVARSALARVRVRSCSAIHGWRSLGRGRRQSGRRCDHPRWIAPYRVLALIGVFK